MWLGTILSAAWWPLASRGRRILSWCSFLKQYGCIREPPIREMAQNGNNSRMTTSYILDNSGDCARGVHFSGVRRTGTSRVRHGHVTGTRVLFVQICKNWILSRVRHGYGHLYSLAVLLRIYFRNLWACWNPHAARGTNDHGTGTASHLALGAVFTFLDVGKYRVLGCKARPAMRV